MTPFEKGNPDRVKWALTTALISIIVGFGISYQYFFQKAEEHYRKIISQQYRNQLNAEAPEAELQRWMIYAFDGMSLEQIKQEIARTKNSATAFQ